MTQDPARAQSPSFLAKLRDINAARGAVERVTGLLRSLDRVIEIAEQDLLTYYHHGAGRFVRNSNDVSHPKPAAHVLSNAAAIIALDLAPSTERYWSTCRPKVYSALIGLDRSSQGLTHDNPFTNAQIAVAFASRPAPDTFCHLAGGRAARSWPVILLENIQRNGGGVSIPSLGGTARTHSYSTYWAFRALVAHHAAIRAIDHRLDERLKQVMEFSANTLYQLRTETESDSFDAVGCAFALATLWSAPDWLERSPQLGDIKRESQVATAAFKHIMSAQRSRGHWRSGSPLWTVAPRTDIYAFPADLLYGMFERVPELLQPAQPLSGKHHLRPDDVLDEKVLDAVEAFIGWAEREHYPRQPVTGEIENAVEPRGWGSSTYGAAQTPESWATAVVLRAAKAVRRGIDAAASLAAYVALEEPEAKPTDWRRMCFNERVRESLQKLWTPGPGKPPHLSAILAGPPGTGKTTVARSAAGAGRIIYIAPHVLTDAGPDKISQRLQQVFSTLELLDGGVVLFDEIDEVVLERELVADESASRLLTTSMLPRFQRLKDMGKISFMVATNHVEKFDAAIRREGRFDEVIAVEFPDPSVRKQVYLQAIGDHLLATKEGRRALARREGPLLDQLLGPVTAGDDTSGWHTSLRNLTEHQGIAYWLDEVLANFHQETLDFLQQIQQAQENVVNAASHLGDADAALAQLARACSADANAVIEQIKAAWACAMVVSSSSDDDCVDIELRQLRRQLPALLEAPNLSGSLDAFEWCERVHECWNTVVTLLGAPTGCQAIPAEGGLQKRLAFCQEVLQAEVPGSERLREALLALSNSAAGCSEPKRPGAAALASKRELLSKLRNWLERTFDRFPLGREKRALPREFEQLLADLPAAGATPVSKARGELLQQIVHFFVETVAPGVATSLRGAVYTWSRGLRAAAEARTPTGSSNEDNARAALGRIAAQLDLTMDAWWVALRNRCWLFDTRGPGKGIPRGFLLTTPDLKALRGAVFANAEGADRQDALAQSWGNLKKPQLAELFAEWGGQLKLLHPMDGTASSNTLASWLWRYSKLRSELAGIVSEVLEQPWQTSDEVPCADIPWGLPGSCDERPRLLVGQHLTHRELHGAANAAVKALRLASEEGIAELLSDASAQMSAAARNRCCSAIRASMSKASQSSRFYLEAENYTWRLDAMDPPPRRDLKPHGHLKLPPLNAECQHLLREHPVLSALRADAENDAKLIPRSSQSRT